MRPDDQAQAALQPFATAATGGAFGVPLDGRPRQRAPFFRVDQAEGVDGV